MINGKLMRKMIRADFPYDLQLKVINDSEINPRIVNDWMDHLLSLDKSMRALANKPKEQNSTEVNHD